MPTLFKQLQTARDHEPPVPRSPVTDTGSTKSSSGRKVSRASQARVEARKEFLRVTTKGSRDEIYTNPESLPLLDDAYNNFQSIYPKFGETWAVDDLREREYFHLEEGEHVCMDYCGFGLFSHYQQVISKASSSFGLAYISANLSTHALYGAAEDGTAEAYIRKRVMDYLKVNDREYSMVFTASRGSAFKLLAESYPFHLNQRLLTVYDFESEAVNWMAQCAKQKGAKIMSACFKWPSLRVGTTDLKKQLQEKKKRGDSAKGLFVFPVQSRMTGAKYSYQWMSQAQQNKWHVLLDASALGPKDMDSLGLSLFRPDFIVSSFYKVFGTDPTGFGCLFIKNSAIHSLHNSSRARAVGMVRIVSMNNNSTDGHDERESEDGDLEESGWRLDQQAGMSSFSGPVSSFYTEVDADKEHSSLSREKNLHATAKLPKSNGKRVGEIEHSGQLRRVNETEEELFDEEDELSGRFSGRLRGYIGYSGGVIEDFHEDDMSEIEYSGQLTQSRYDLERMGRVSEIEENLPRSGLLSMPRNSFGRDSSEIAEELEQKPRRSLREQLHEPQTSPLKTVSEILQEDYDAPRPSRFFRVPPRRSYRLEDDEELSVTPGIIDRRSGEAEDSGGEEFDDRIDSNGKTCRTSEVRGQFELTPDRMLQSVTSPEDRYVSNLDREISQIEEEIEEREFSRTALSDIEEEKGMEVEGKMDSDESDDDRVTQQRYSAREESPSLSEIQIEESQSQSSEIPKGEKAENGTNMHPRAPGKKSTVDSIKARLQKFVNRASFRKHSGKEMSEFQEHGVQALVTKYESLPSGSEFPDMEGNLDPNSEGPLFKRRSPSENTNFLSERAIPGDTSSGVRYNVNGDVRGEAVSPSFPVPHKPNESVGQTSGSDSDDQPVVFKEVLRSGPSEGSSSQASKIVPGPFDVVEEEDRTDRKQYLMEDLPSPLQNDTPASPSACEGGESAIAKGSDAGKCLGPARGPSFSFSETDRGVNRAEEDMLSWKGQNELLRSGSGNPDQAVPAPSSEGSAVHDELENRPAGADVGDARGSSSGVANGLQHAHSFGTDGGGTPYESGEENYITILPGSRSSKNWDRIPEPVDESPDTARRGERNSSRDGSPSTPLSPVDERGLEKREHSALSPEAAGDLSDMKETPKSSGMDGVITCTGFSPESPKSEFESKLAVLFTPHDEKATPRSSGSTPINATSNQQTERSNAEDLSFDEAEFHDAKDQPGINGASDLRSGRTLSRDVNLDDDMFIASRERSTLAEDLARVDMQDSDDESYYRAQYHRDSYNGSSTSRQFEDDIPPSASYQEETDDDSEDMPDGDQLENGDPRHPKIVCKGLDLADSLGLTKTNYRLRYLINWLVNSLLKLRHPSQDNRGVPLVRIYGPKVKYDRGAAVAFNLFDWKGGFIQPGLVQRLADRSNISLGVGRLCNIVDPDLSPGFLAEKERWCGLDRSHGGKDGTLHRAGRSESGKSSAGKWDSLTIPVVTAALGFVTSFEDVYRLWSFLANFLDADFVSKEVWRYHSLNQQTVVV